MHQSSHAPAVSLPHPVLVAALTLERTSLLQLSPGQPPLAGVSFFALGFASSRVGSLLILATQNYHCGGIHINHFLQLSFPASLLLASRAAHAPIPPSKSHRKLCLCTLPSPLPCSLCLCTFGSRHPESPCIRPLSCTSGCLVSDRLSSILFLTQLAEWLLSCGLDEGVPLLDLSRSMPRQADREGTHQGPWGLSKSSWLHPLCPCACRTRPRGVSLFLLPDQFMHYNQRCASLVEGSARKPS